MKGWEKILIKGWTWSSLILSGVLFSLIFVEFGKIQEWIIPGFNGIPFPIWFVGGGFLGVALSWSISKWPVTSRKVALRGGMLVFGYIGIAVVAAFMGGEGEGFDRIGNSAPVKIWGMMIWSLLVLTPSVLGVVGILRKMKWARGGSVLAYITISATLMIYEQASSARVLSQDPALSILFICALVGYVEGVNWTKRFLDEEGLSILFRRQASFTILFLGIGSAVAFLPFLLSGEILPFYEGEVMIGKAVVGALLLSPLGLLAIVKGIRDRYSG